MQGVGQQVHVDELVGEQRLVLVLETRLEFQGAGGDVDLVVQAVQHAGGLAFHIATVPGFHGQLVAGMVTGEHGFQGAFRQGEGHADRLGLGDDRKRGGVVGRHQVAHVDLAQTDPATDRCADLGEFEVELGVVHRALVGLDRALVLQDQRFGRVEGLLGDTVLGVEVAITLDVDLGVLQLGLVLHQRALGLEQGVLVAARVDLGQQVAGLDHLPFLKGDLHQLAAYPAAHIDGVERRHRPQGLVVNREVPQHRRRHAHRHRAGGTAEARTHHPRLACTPGRWLRGAILVAARPEFPAQTSDDQQHEQAEQPAAGVAGGGLHGVINHWARELLFGEAER